jgi:hypothetical protein
MLFEDLFYDDDFALPTHQNTAQLNQNGRSVPLEADFLNCGDVLRWNRAPELRRVGGTGLLGEAKSQVQASA